LIFTIIQDSEYQNKAKKKNDVVIASIINIDSGKKRIFSKNSPIKNIGVITIKLGDKIVWRLFGGAQPSVQRAVFAEYHAVLILIIIIKIAIITFCLFGL